MRILGFLGAIALGALVAACGAAVPRPPTGSPSPYSTPSPSPYVYPYVTVLDTLIKPSVEADSVVFAALVRGTYSPQLVPSSWSSTSWAGGRTSWGDSGWLDLCPSGKAPCFWASPNERQDFCVTAMGGPVSSSAPSSSRPYWKLLDAAHPDAVQPALERAFGRIGEAFKGWLSWQVETRPDCRTVMSATYTLAFPTLDDPLATVDEPLAQWEWAGPDAEKPGTQLIGEGWGGGPGRTEIGKVVVPAEGLTVLRVWNDSERTCSFSLLLDTSAVYPRVILTVPGEGAAEVAVGGGELGSGEIGGGEIDTTCKSWLAGFERRGPPYD